jgi:hypothetical protein
MQQATFTILTYVRHASGVFVSSVHGDRHGAAPGQTHKHSSFLCKMLVWAFPTSRQVPRAGRRVGLGQSQISKDMQEEKFDTLVVMMIRLSRG